MKVGFIGTGSMGSTLIDAFIRTNALQPQQIIAANRTFSKAERLAEEHPGLRAVPDNREAVVASDIVFLCIKPKEFKSVIDEIRSSLTPDHIVVSITSPVLLRHLEEHLPCKIAKIIPSITNLAGSGATLTMYGCRMESGDIYRLETLLEHISKPVEVSEEYTRICSDLSSCGPAFLAFFIEQFVNSAVLYTGIPRGVAVQLASEMVLGTGQLLTSYSLSPEELREKVSVPGGITAEGLRMLSLDLEGTFDRLVRTTHHKYKEEVDKVEGLFYNPSQT